MHSSYTVAQKIAILILTPMPWPAVDPLVDLLEHRKSRTRGSGAECAQHGQNLIG
jgi:hypothetical protein